MGIPTSPYSTNNPTKTTTSVGSSGTSNSNGNSCSNITSMNSSDTIECDYDVNPTSLYLGIQHKKWNEVYGIIQAHPQQTKTWVSRKEEEDALSGVKNKLRWRLLPLHAAIIFKAPESVIQALLVAYPRACCYKDDQGMLPIHLALRNESSEAIVTMLLVAFPQCTQIGDKKNRTPIHVAQISKSVHKDSYINALQNYKLYYEVASASYNAFTLFEAKNNPSTNIGVQVDAQKLSLMGKVDSLEMELAKSRDENQLLVDHINLLNSRMTSQNDSESYLVQKISNLEAKVKEAKQEKEMMEVQYQRQIASSSKRLELLQEEVESNQQEIEIYKQINDEKDMSLEIANETSDAASNEREKLEEKVKLLEIENATVLANSAVLETQLKRKIQNEHSLATQVSDLASKLSESALMCSELTNSHQKRIEVFQREKMELKTSYAILTRKLQDAFKTMNEMTKENNRMVELSASQDTVISEMYKQQEELAAHASRHEQTLIDAAWEREEIVRILTRQAEEVEKSNNERNMLMKIVKNNNEKIASSAEERNQLFSSISKQKGLMDSLKQDVKDLFQTVNDEVDGISMGSDKENEYFTFKESEEVIPSLSTTRSGAQYTSFLQEDEGIDEKPSLYKKPSLETVTTINASGSVEMLPTTSTLSSDSSEISDSLDQQNDYDDALGEIHMNVNHMSLGDRNNKSMDDVESSVDNLCKEAAALIASIPSPSKNAT